MTLSPSAQATILDSIYRNELKRIAEKNLPPEQEEKELKEALLTYKARLYTLTNPKLSYFRPRT